MENYLQDNKGGAEYRMETTILKNIPFNVDVIKLREKLRIKENTSYVSKLEELINDAKKVANLKAMYKLVYIEEKGEDYVVIDGIKFVSKILRINLDKVNRAFAFVATCGQELEEWSEKKTDFLEQFWADAIKEEALRCAITELNVDLKEKYQLGNTGEMNPGSLGDWPISEQKDLFELLGDTEELVGVKLKPSFLMAPVKSVSGIIFASETNYKNCQLCPREKCPSRKAPYDEELLKSKYKG